MKAEDFLKQKYGANFESESGSIKPKQFWTAIAKDMEEYSSQKSNPLLDSLTEFVDYYEDMKPVLNDEMQAMLNRAEKAIRKAI